MPWAEVVAAQTQLDKFKEQAVAFLPVGSSRKGKKKSSES
jgi:hypothetical protein